MRTIVGAGISV